MNKCFCDICGDEIVYDLRKHTIITTGIRDGDQDYISENISHLCEDCRQKFLATIKTWMQDNMSDKNKERIKD